MNLKEKSKEELTRLLNEQQDRLRQLRFDLSAGQIKNISEIKKTKRTIARILTALKSNKCRNEK